MRHHPLRFALALILAACAFGLSACGKTYTHEEATADIAPDTITNRTDWAADVQDTGEVQDGWIKTFDDPVLDRLVDEAMRGNPSLKAAASRVDQANAQAAQAEAGLRPSVGVGGQLSQVTASDWTPTSQGLGVGVSWEADVWGRISQGVRAAEESAAQVKANYEFARQSLAASVAKAWFLACETRMQLAFMKEVVGILEQMNGIVAKKQKVGKVSMQDVHQIHAQLAMSREAEVSAESARQEAARSLEILLGRYPSAELEAADLLNTNLPPIPAGMPSDILSRRPDLIAAQDRVAAAFYAEKGAELLHLPSFVIQGAGGISGLGNAIAGLTAGVFAPLYTGGRIEAEIAQADAAQKEAVADYAAAALNAFKEVETGLADEKLLADRETYLDQAVEDSRKAFELSEVKYKVGKVGLFEVLELQSRWIGAQITQLDLRREELDNRVNLHLALGGSFETVE